MVALLMIPGAQVVGVVMSDGIKRSCCLPGSVMCVASISGPVQYDAKLIIFDCFCWNIIILY